MNHLASLSNEQLEQIPDADIGEIVSRAIIDRLEKVEARKFAKLKEPKRAERNAPVHSDEPSDVVVPTRAPSREIVRIISKRDDYRCCYVSPDGRRCTSLAWIEKDHRKSWAYGGRTSVANMQLMCRAHNQFKARRAP